MWISFTLILSLLDTPVSCIISTSNILSENLLGLNHNKPLSFSNLHFDVGSNDPSVATDDRVISMPYLSQLGLLQNLPYPSGIEPFDLNSHQMLNNLLLPLISSLGSGFMMPLIDPVFAAPDGQTGANERIEVAQSAIPWLTVPQFLTPPVWDLLAQLQTIPWTSGLERNVPHYENRLSVAPGIWPPASVVSNIEQNSGLFESPMNSEGQRLAYQADLEAFKALTRLIREISPSDMIGNKELDRRVEEPIGSRIESTWSDDERKQDENGYQSDNGSQSDERFVESDSPTLVRGLQAVHSLKTRGISEVPTRSKMFATFDSLNTGNKLMLWDFLEPVFADNTRWLQDRVSKLRLPFSRLGSTDESKLATYPESTESSQLHSQQEELSLPTPIYDTTETLEKRDREKDWKNQISSLIAELPDLLKGLFVRRRLSGELGFLSTHDTHDMGHDSLAQRQLSSNDLSVFKSEGQLSTKPIPSKARRDLACDEETQSQTQKDEHCCGEICKFTMEVPCAHKELYRLMVSSMMSGPSVHGGQTTTLDADTIQLVGGLVKTMIEAAPREKEDGGFERPPEPPKTPESKFVDAILANLRTKRISEPLLPEIGRDRRLSELINTILEGVHLPPLSSLPSPQYLLYSLLNRVLMLPEPPTLHLEAGTDPRVAWLQYVVDSDLYWHQLGEALSRMSQDDSMIFEEKSDETSSLIAEQSTPNIILPEEIEHTSKIDSDYNTIPHMQRPPLRPESSA